MAVDGLMLLVQISERHQQIMRLSYIIHPLTVPAVVCGVGLG
jgi:hypothetical protein